MAGDWIKLEHATADKPEVFRMAMALGIAPEHVVGCLARVWVWADQQSLDGNAISVTGVTLDRVACYAGFAQAMQSVGWLHGKDGEYSLPNFDRHNGETAKKRGLTKRRVATHRALHGNADGVTREEKRREELTSNTTPKDIAGAAKHERKGAGKTALPEGFTITPEMRDWANDHGYTNLQGHLSYFIDSARAKDYRYKDWNAAFRNAVKANWAKLPNHPGDKRKRTAADSLLNTGGPSDGSETAESDGRTIEGNATRLRGEVL